MDVREILGPDGFEVFAARAFSLGLTEDEYLQLLVEIGTQLPDTLLFALSCGCPVRVDVSASFDVE